MVAALLAFVQGAHYAQIALAQLQLHTLGDLACSDTSHSPGFHQNSSATAAPFGKPTVARERWHLGYYVNKQSQAYPFRQASASTPL